MSALRFALLRFANDRCCTCFTGVELKFLKSMEPDSNIPKLLC